MPFSVFFGAWRA